MKKIILFSFIFILIGCNDTTKNIKAPKGGNTITDAFRTIIIDSCEYIAGYNRLAHKGNCEFCEERRNQETIKLIEQLVEQLKK